MPGSSKRLTAAQRKKIKMRYEKSGRRKDPATDLVLAAASAVPVAGVAARGAAAGRTAASAAKASRAQAKRDKKNRDEWEMLLPELKRHRKQFKAEDKAARKAGRKAGRDAGKTGSKRSKGGQRGSGMVYSDTQAKQAVKDGQLPKRFSPTNSPKKVKVKVKKRGR